MLNFSRILNKKFLFVFVIVLILAVGGFFWWQGREIKGSPEDYVIIETEEGKFVENKKAGLLVKAPEGWEVEKMEVDEGVVMFYSLDTEIEWRNNLIVLPLKRGCVIRTTVVYKEMDFDQIRKEVTYTHSMFGRKSEEFEEITINSYPALKNSFDTQELGPGIEVYISQESKLYGFFFVWAPDEKERCVQEFESFLETISID